MGFQPIYLGSLNSIIYVYFSITRDRIRQIYLKLSNYMARASGTFLSSVDLYSIPILGT